MYSCLPAMRALSMCACMHICMRLLLCVPARRHACMQWYVYVRMYVCLYACMYGCMPAVVSDYMPACVYATGCVCWPSVCMHTYNTNYHGQSHTYIHTVRQADWHTYRQACTHTGNTYTHTYARVTRGITKTLRSQLAHIHTHTQNDHIRIHRSRHACIQAYTQ